MLNIIIILKRHSADSYINQHGAHLPTQQNCVWMILDLLHQLNKAIKCHKIPDETYYVTEYYCYLLSTTKTHKHGH